MFNFKSEYVVTQKVDGKTGSKVSERKRKKTLRFRMKKYTAGRVIYLIVIILGGTSFHWPSVVSKLFI